MTFIDGTTTHEILACEPPTPETIRHVAVGVIGAGIKAGETTEDERQLARDVAEALGLRQPTRSPDATFRDPITGSRRKWVNA